jgi:hypothetical protein
VASLAPHFYPKDRPQYFAVQFCRLLSDRKAAREIGASGLALLTVIVMAEDATGYTKAVRFWREDLAARLGISVGQLWRIRNKCIAAGWLEYIEPDKRGCGYFWVTVPAEVSTARPAAAYDYDLEVPPETDETTARRRNDQRAPAQRPARAGATPSSLSSLSSLKTPLPPEAGGVCVEPVSCGSDQTTPAVEPPATAPVAAASPAAPEPRAGLFGEIAVEAEIVAPERSQGPPRAFYRAAGSRRSPRATSTQQRSLFEAIAEVTGSDPQVNYRRVQRLTMRLAASGLEPEHVREFGERFHELCGLSPEVRALHPRPSLRMVEEYIGRLRSSAAVPTAIDPAADPRLLVAAIAEVTGLDPQTSQAPDGLARVLLGAGTPYTPDEVREFGQQFWALCPWAAKDRRRLPTVNEIQKYIGQIRSRASPPKAMPRLPTPSVPEVSEHERQKAAEMIRARLQQRAYSADVPTQKEILA